MGPTCSRIICEGCNDLMWEAMLAELGTVKVLVLVLVTDVLLLL